jgi:hypothetical protein
MILKKHRATSCLVFTIISFSFCDAIDRYRCESKIILLNKAIHLFDINMICGRIVVRHVIAS